jgi:hypothetical protein
MFRELHKFRSVESGASIGAQDIIMNFPAPRANGPHRLKARFDFRISCHDFLTSTQLGAFKPAKERAIWSFATIVRS